MDDLIVISGEKKYKGLVEKCIELDKLCYQEKYQGEIDKYNYFFDLNPESFIFVLDKNTNNMAGYLLFVPLKGKTYNQLKSGNYIDVSLIKKEDITSLTNGINNLYLYSMIVSPAYRGKGLADILVDEFIKKNEVRFNKGIIIDNMLADVINPSAIVYLKGNGFTIVNSSSHNSVLLERDEYPDIDVVS